MRGSWDSALIDLFNVTQLAPNLADGYASLGALAVLRGASLAVSREALDPFKRALDIDPVFALAYNGRGCILFGSGRFAEAAADFETAADLLPTLVVADLNAGHATTYAASVVTLAKVDAKPGTTLQTRVTVIEERVRALRQEVAKLMPDPVFWDQIKRFPELSPEQVAGLKEKYGPDKVQMAIWVTKESILPRNRELTWTRST